MKKYVLLLLITILFERGVVAQNFQKAWDCGSPELLSRNISDNPGIQTVFDNYKNAVAAIVNSTTTINTPTAPYVIPVVFHIIADAYTTTPIPTYEQIQWQLATLNAAFSNSLASLNLTSPGSRAVNTQIQFCFAKQVQTSTTPTAWPTASVGVLTYTTTNTSLISNIVMTNTTSLQNLGALTSYTLGFPPTKYLNIWCVPNITNLSSGYNIMDPPGIIGFATLPFGIGVLDGIVMRNDCIGNNNFNSFNMFQPLDQGNILAHEAGHYLGLFHTFESISNFSLSTAGSSGCYGTGSLTAYSDGDLVYDTPPTMINGNIGTGIYNTCSENYAPYGALADETDQIENFMAYTDDDYLNTFTLEQAARMWAALGGAVSFSLNGQRSNLVTTSNLLATGVISVPYCGPGVLSSTFEAIPIPASITCTSVAVQFSVPAMPGYLSATSYTWAFGDGGTSNSANPIHTYTMPPSSYTVTLTTSDGNATSTSTTVVNISNGQPVIIGSSGSNFPVCRNTEQTIFIKFPANSTSAILTDGTNFYTVNSNLTHTCSAPTGIYIYPYTFTVTSNVSFSLVPANCGTVSNGVATFTVIDCCNNLVTNGDMESGNTGFYSSYVLTSTNVGSPNPSDAAINFPSATNYTVASSALNLTGKTFISDSPFWGSLGTACNYPGQEFVLLGQSLTGLKPSTTYYISFKTNQSQDSVILCGPKKLKLKLYSTPTGTLINQNRVPSSITSTACTTAGGSIYAQQIFNFTVTTPSTSTLTSTTFSLEILEIDRFYGNGFDYLIDNIILAEMNPAIAIAPLASTICPSNTVQLTASNNCVNISNYSLVWQPQSSLSCSTCANPIANPSVTTVYTLVAVPSSTTPPLPSIVLTTTVFVAFPVVTVTSPTPCSGSFTLNASSVPSVTWQPGGSTSFTVASTPTAPTNYTASYQAPGCLNSTVVTLYPPQTITITPSSSVVCGQLTTVTLTAVTPNTLNPITYTWVPSNSTGLSYITTPTANITYTVKVKPILGCETTQTISLSVTNTCCPSSSIAPFTSTALSSGSFTSPLVIYNSFTVQPNQWVTLANSQFLIAPNVKITVSPGAKLEVLGSHLYACSSDMWQGIIIQDGGKLTMQPTTSRDNLVEDAITAIDITNYQTTTISPVAEINQTTFNKNYIDLNVSNYTITSSILLQDNVFTCRNLPFTSTQWPKTGTVSAATNATADLRYVNTGLTPTTGLAPPYLNQSGFTITTLKNPYSSQPSHIAINLSTVGVTSGTAATNGTVSMPGITIGNDGNATNFNLFDAHGSFIVSNHSNVTLKNNVFQNTRTYTVASGNNYSGSAIKHIELGTMHTMLNMSATVTTKGNRFWDCHKSVDLRNTYLLWFEGAIVRSTQTSTTAATSYSPGNMGIFATTNRFDYYIANSEFTNLRTGINIPVTPATLAIAPCSVCAYYGVFANRIRIAYNTFAAGTPTSAYMDQGIYITGMQGSPYYIPTTSVSPFVQAFSITGNTLTNVTNGAWVNSSRGFQVDMSNNDVFLRETGSMQHGFKLTNSSPTTSTSVGKNIISGNTASLSAALSGTGSSLVFCGHNGVGVQSPSVTCNSLAESYEGFVFEGYNQNATWMGNDMTTPMNRALALYTAAIGTQGGTTFASNNRWVGGTGSWTSSYYGTYVGNNSNALNSFLYVASGSAPPNNLSFNPLADYFNMNAYATASGGGDYTCGDFPNAKIIVPEPGHYDTDVAYYMAMDDFYRFNLTNDSVRNSDITVDNYVSGLSGNSVDYFYQIDEKLYQHDVTGASDILTAMDDDGFNTVETNYKTYFLCHLSYLNLGPTDPYPYSDSIALRDLATLCPGGNGSPVYRAISLYNSIYGQVLTPDCSGTSRRMMSEGLGKNSISSISQIKLFPNPANDQLTIETKSVNQELTIEIRDLSNRVVLTRTLKTSGFFANLDLNLINGVYLISVKDSKGERAIKKLVISK